MDSGLVLDLEEIFFVPSLRHNLIFIFRLLLFGYDVIFKYSGRSVNLHGELVGSDLLVDGLFRLTLDASYEQFFIR